MLKYITVIIYLYQYINKQKYIYINININKYKSFTVLIHIPLIYGKLYVDFHLENAVKFSFQTYLCIKHDNLKRSLGAPR